MSTKLCVQCGESPKMPGHPKWCGECWLPRQPMQVQVDHAQQRLALVPEGQRITRVPERFWPAGRRWCAGCQTFVRLTYTSGARCRACASRGAQNSRLRGQYAIHGRPFTAEDYDRLLQAQGGRCYLCLRRAGARRFAVDHDHETGEVRGLLCADDDWGCNLKIVARFDADPEPLAMVERLRQYYLRPPAKDLP